jgi:hypothetical protein
MCSYCHEFIKRNQSVCGYCGKMFPKKEEPTINEIKIQGKISKWRIVFLGLIIISVLFGGTFFFENFRTPALLETVEISEPTTMKLVKLNPPEPSKRY